MNIEFEKIIIRTKIVILVIRTDCKSARSEFKPGVGGGGNIFTFRSGNWHGVGIGGNVEKGVSINYLAAFHSATMQSVMLNNQTPTKDRSWLDRAINAPANILSLGQALYQHAKK